MAMCGVRETTLRSRCCSGEDSPSCLLCRFCFFEAGVDKVRPLCYSDGTGTVDKKTPPSLIDEDGYKIGFCRSFQYRTTQIDEETLESYIGH